MKNQEIIETVLSHFQEPYRCHSYFEDGTYSTVMLLNDSYLIKQSNPSALHAEVEFLQANTSEMMQKVIYYDATYLFVVYKFIPGQVMKQVEDIPDLLSKLLSIIKQYPASEEKGYGYVGEEVESWSDFLKEEMQYSTGNITRYISHTVKVEEAIMQLQNYPFVKSLLHGDLGAHNFIENNHEFVGIIDPMPLIGDPLYDLLFAIASHVDILQNVSLENIQSITQEPREKIIALMKVVLYSRISRCLKYHPKDITVYMNYWDLLCLTV